MAIKVFYDLDLEEDLSAVYEDAQDTIAYLQDLIKSIEKRVLGGEEIAGLKVVSGRGTRTITPQGLKYLSKTLGEDLIYETKKTPIGITKLDALISAEDMEELIRLGYVYTKEGIPKVVLE